MRLSKIKLAGFKSFVDPTTLAFQSNLTAIVGPNGCGKSNIIDAIRWVIGESSAKHLRSESMSDVIFNGASQRKPVGKAAIELGFDQCAGKLSGEYANLDEIAIRREITREGASQFYLNGSRCRRRDITDIFLGSGLGPRSYAVIEQGTISRIIEAKPDELRTYLEEVAGISKYKARRHETEIRIRHTQENLDRLLDIMAELEKQLAHLKRQARAAERYQVLKTELQQLKGQLHALMWQDFSQQKQHYLEREQQLAIEIETKTTEQTAVSATIDSLHTEQETVQAALNGVQNRYYSLGTDIARIEQKIQHAEARITNLQRDLQESQQNYQTLSQDRADDQRALQVLLSNQADLAPQLEQMQRNALAAKAEGDIQNMAMHDWQVQWDQFNQQHANARQTLEVERTRIDYLQKRRDNFGQQLEHLYQDQAELAVDEFTTEIDTLATEIEQQTNQEAELTASLGEIDEQIIQLRQQQQTLQQQKQMKQGALQQLEAQVLSLELLQKAALGQDNEQFNVWLQQHELADKPRLLAEINVVPQWQMAAETVLGGFLQGFCVEDLEGASEHLAAGLTQQLCLITPTTTDMSSARLDLETLSSKVQSTFSIAPFLANIYLAESLPQALALRSQLQAHESIITSDGIWLGVNWLKAGSHDGQDGLLARAQALKQLNAEMVTAQSALDSVITQLESVSAQLDAEEAQRVECQQAHHEVAKQLSEAKAQWQTKQAWVQERQLKAQAIAEKIVAAKAEQAETQVQLAAAAEQCEQATAIAAQAQVRREALQTERQQLQTTLAQARDALTQVNRDVDHIQLQLSAGESKKQFIEQNIQRGGEQIERLQTREKTLQTELATLAEPLPQWQVELETLLAQRLTVESELNEVREQAQTFTNKIRGVEQQRQQLEQVLQDLRSQLANSRIEKQALEVHCENQQEQITAMDLTLATLLTEMPEEADKTQWEDNILQLQNKIQRLGAINLAAIDEYAQLQERHEYLQKQHADLVEALDTLKGAIKKIDQETKQKFKETFDVVNQHFSSLFPTVFGGGQAQLILTEDDLLTAGVKVMAQPPGKRNSNIHVLSGGEKALTAISLVFALFQLNPAPFCILDEVDAPLDDANVNRFCELVKQLAEKVQFVFISHNKITIAMANQLAGVTMQEAGVSRLVQVDIDNALKMVEQQTT